MKNVTRGHIAFIITGIITLLALCGLTYTQLSAVDYASTARGADIYVLSDTQTMRVGEEATVEILLTNDNTPLNVMETELYFDPTFFFVTKVTFANSLCEDRFVIDEEIDNVAGRVHISCGTITPFTGNATIFGTLTLIPKKTGVSAITFGEKTHVYVHDGLGTEIARDKYNGSFFIDEA